MSAGGWQLICGDCTTVLGEAIKSVGIIQRAPYACDGCGKALPTNGGPRGSIEIITGYSPVFPEQLARLKVKLGAST